MTSAEAAGTQARSLDDLIDGKCPSWSGAGSPPEAVDLVALLRLVIRDPELPAYGRITTSSPLPVVCAQRTLLRQLFLCMLVNALERTAGRAPVVDIGCFDGGATWDIWFQVDGAFVDVPHRAPLDGDGPHSAAPTGADVDTPLDTARDILAHVGGALSLQAREAGTTFVVAWPKRPCLEVVA